MPRLRLKAKYPNLGKRGRRAEREMALGRMGFPLPHLKAKG
jgi:hypothetical protein